MKRTAILIDGEFFALALKNALKLGSRPTPLQTHKNALGLALAGVGALFGAIFRRAERALSVYAAAVVLVGGVLFVLLHSLFISD